MADMDSAPSKAAQRDGQQGHRSHFLCMVPSMNSATVGRTQSHPLARMHCAWGVVFLGSKDELQSAGFGVGSIFPGEPGGNKKKAIFPACNGFSKIEVCLSEGKSWFGEPSQSTLPNYEIRASYIDDEAGFKREFEAVLDMPAVLLYRNTREDVYRGSAQALISASLIDASQLPGQDGTGKIRTTFTKNGVRVKSGSTNQNREGNRTIKAVGKFFEVAVRVSAEEREIRYRDYMEKSRVRKSEKAQKIAQYLQKIALPQTVVTSRTKSHLKLVWSA